MPPKKNTGEKTKQSQKQEQNVKIVINQADKKKQTKPRRKRASKAPETYLTPEQKMRMYQTYAPPQITYNTTLPNSDILNVLRSNLSRNDGILPIMSDVRQGLNPAVRQEADQIRMVNRVAQRARDAYVGQAEPQPVLPQPEPVRPVQEPPRRRPEPQAIEISSSPGNVIVNQEPLEEILRSRQRRNENAQPVYRDYGGGAGGIYNDAGVDFESPVPRRVVRVDISPVRPSRPPIEDIAPAASPPPTAVPEASPSSSTALVSRPPADIVPASNVANTNKPNTMFNYFKSVVKRGVNKLTPQKKDTSTKVSPEVPDEAYEKGIIPYIPQSPDSPDFRTGTFAPPPSTSPPPSQIGTQGKSMRNKLDGAQAKTNETPDVSSIPRNKDNTFKKNSKEYRALEKIYGREAMQMFENSTLPFNPNFGRLDLVLP